MVAIPSLEEARKAGDTGAPTHRAGGDSPRPGCTPDRASPRAGDAAGKMEASGGRRMWRLRWLAAAAAGLLAGCAAGPEPRETAGEDAATATGGGSVPVESGLTRDVLYKLLVGEFAGRRGHLPLSIESYLDVARETRDAGVAEQAARVAAFSRDSAKTLEAARLWSEIDPSSVGARQVLVSLLLRSGDLDAATGHLRDVVDDLSDSPAAGFVRAGDLLAREQDGEAAVAVMRRLVAGREDDPAAQSALARLLARKGRFEEASALFDRVFELDPGDARIAIARARVRRRMDDLEGALAVLSAYLERVPGESTVRTAYARLLVDARRYEPARAQFERLLADEPGNDDVRYALGLLLMQTDRLDEASRQFEALAQSAAWRDTAHYNLARIAESRRRLDDAIAWYRRVRGGEQRLEAQIRVAVLLAEGGDLESARGHLHGLRGANLRETVRIHRAEGELLARAGRHEEAMAVYDASLEALPGNSDLLYARGMLAERMGRLDILERDMREIIAREPDNADALNALGYTLADRTDRYEEAYALIQRALELKPDNHYIVDSMGWVLHRLGRHREALVQLRRAMSISPDPEIAAHLGEVLWVLGEKAEARKVWDAALEETPDDERLLDAIRRFAP